MSDTSENSAFTVTLKAGAHYENPWIVVRGETTEELLELLDALGKSGVVAKTVEVSIELQGVYAAAKGLPAVPVAVEVAPTAISPTSPAPLALVPQAPVAAQSGPLCQHGAMVPRSGTKNGRNWSGWFCPTPQGTPDQCSPQFNKN
jgi:hypothetical protein